MTDEELLVLSPEEAEHLRSELRAIENLLKQGVATSVVLRARALSEWLEERIQKPTFQS